jgi:hypothetical protein
LEDFPGPQVPLICCASKSSIDQGKWISDQEMQAAERGLENRNLEDPLP